MNHSTSFTLRELAALTSSELVGDPNYSIKGVESLEIATEEDASFLANPLYIKLLKRSKAGVVFVTCPPSSEYITNYLIHPNPSQAFQRVIELFHDDSLSESSFTGIHSTCVIHPSVQIAEDVTIGPYTIIDQKTCIGKGTSIAGHVHIGPSVSIGSRCKIHASVTIRENCELHNSVIIQPGAVIGSCGFGYITDAMGQHNKLRHVGRVILEDQVEIGANTTIDRGRFTDTCIKKGAKVDNLVQIGHGVVVGEGCMIVSQAGIAGSTTLGKYNVIAGQVGIVGHIQTADHITIAARGAITKNLVKSGRYGGAPAVPEERYYKQQMHIRKLDTYAKMLKELQEKVHLLEKQVETAKI